MASNWIHINYKCSLSLDMVPCSNPLDSLTVLLIDFSYLKISDVESLTRISSILLMFIRLISYQLKVSDANLSFSNPLNFLDVPLIVSLFAQGLILRSRCSNFLYLGVPTIGSPYALGLMWWLQKSNSCINLSRGHHVEIIIFRESSDKNSLSVG